jgi:TolB-like protein/Tfp pilus assembly protein PilF/tRNA A-37 threonylcarbamoyl transferase component Bud32
MSILPGTVLAGRYTVLRELGRGGMATVYVADDARLNRRVAIKTLVPEIATVIGAERFLREIEVAARLSHPLIVPLLDSVAIDQSQGSDSPLLFYVMALVDGESLRDRLKREHQLPVDDAVRIARDVAVALSYAHEQGVVHRDIKPENILLSKGTAVVADFGIAKLLADDMRDSRLTETGISIGTAAYMSPEQATGSDDVGGRSDIYSLGTVLYEMLTGEPPFTGASATTILAKRLTDPTPSARRLRDTIPPALDDAIIRALQRVPADRFSTAAEFVDALDRSRQMTAPLPAVPVTSPATRDVAPARSRTSPRLRAAIGLAAVAGVVLAGWAILGRAPDRGTGAPTQIRAIAVLPFEDLSESGGQAHFSLGMSDELITTLSRLPGLRVAARTSSSTAKARGGDARAIGDALQVDAFLDGSVRRAGDSLRVSVQLVNTSDGSTRWSDTYDGSLRDVFSMQERIARAVASALEIELAASRRLVSQPTTDIEAYQLYLRGRLALAQRTNTSLHEAARFFRQVVDRDPSSARAWTGLADAYAVLALNYWGPPGDYFARAKAAALRAVELDSTIAEAHASLATVSFLYDRNWGAAEQAFHRAIEIDPNYPTAHYFYSIFLSGRLRDSEAVHEGQKAKELDPLSPPLAQGAGMAHVLAGRPAEAVPLLREATATFPDYYFPYAWLGLALARSGQPDEGIAAGRRALQLAPGNVLVEAFLGMTLAAAGNREEALQVAERIAARPGDAIPFTYIARIYAGLGDKDRAFAWLARAVRAHEGQVATMLTAGFENIRDDPRFDAIARQAGVK